MENIKFKTVVLQGIIDGYTEDLNSVRQNYDLETFSSKYTLARDLANSNIKKSLDNSRYEFPKFKRGAHEFILIYDKYDKVLYSIMKEETFNGLRKSQNGKKIHYLEALGIINYGKMPVQSQATFIGYEDECRIKNAEQLLGKMLSDDILEEVEVHNLICFNIKNSEMKSARSIQLDLNLDIVGIESWNDCIPVGYDKNNIGVSDIDLDIIDDECAEEIPIEISIKGTDIQKSVK